MSNARLAIVTRTGSLYQDPMAMLQHKTTLGVNTHPRSVDLHDWRMQSNKAPDASYYFITNEIDSSTRK